MRPPHRYDVYATGLPRKSVRCQRCRNTVQLPDYGAPVFLLYGVGYTCRRCLGIRVHSVMNAWLQMRADPHERFKRPRR